MLFGEQGGGVATVAFWRMYSKRESMPCDLRGANETVSVQR